MLIPIELMVVDGQGMTEHFNPDPVKVKQEHLEDVSCVRAKDVDILGIIDVDDFPSEDDRNPDDVVQTEEALPSSDCDDDVVIRWRRPFSPAKEVRRVESDISDTPISSAPKDHQMEEPVPSRDSDDDMVIRLPRRSSPTKEVRRVESDTNNVTISSAHEDKSLSELLDMDMEVINAVERVNEGLTSEARKCRSSP